MKISVNTLPVLVLALLFSACRETTDPIESVQHASAARFAQLKEGNYWVYEAYQVDSTGEKRIPGLSDSSYVKGKQYRNGRAYLVYHDGYMQQDILLRDSANCLVDADGFVYMATGSYGRQLATYNPPYLKIYRFALRHPMQAVTPAGVFNCMGIRDSFVYTPPMDTIVLPSHPDLFQLYSPHVGKVLYDVAFFLPFAMEKQYLRMKLLRYRVN